MAAKKAGFDTYQQYMDNLEVKKKYYREVRKITRKQNLTQLENYGKLIGLNGVPDAYQVDHIISIDEGFHNNIAPDIIGHITNLRIIPWKENLLKSNKNGS